MARAFWQRVGLPALALLGLLAAPAQAQTKTNYLIRGPVAAVTWTDGLTGPVNVDLTVFAFSDLAPAQGDQPLPGPHVAFSATQLRALGGTLIRRQWYGVAPLPAGALNIASDLSSATLTVEVEGTLVERIESRVNSRSTARGRIEIQWAASAVPASTTLSVNNQTAPFAVQFDVIGTGRAAQATVNVTVDGLGGPIQATGPATLLSPGTGLFTLGLE
jgi:hypothetical protein